MITYHTREGIDGDYQAGFTIGKQTFWLQENGNEKHAEWYIRQLRAAFGNMIGQGILQFNKYLLENANEDISLDTHISNFIEQLNSKT